MFPNYLDPAIDSLSPPVEEITNLFPNEEEALYALYEQLFDPPKVLCKYTILNSMRYLIHRYSMTNQMEEMKYMTPEEVSIVDQKEVDREVAQATKEIKQTIYKILEEKLF